MSIKLSKKISISKEVFQKIKAKKWNDIVVFTFINKKTFKEVERKFTLENALCLAHERQCDGRYKNYEYYIGE